MLSRLFENIILKACKNLESQLSFLSVFFFADSFQDE